MAQTSPGKSGLDYAQNYDVITKWLAETFRGQTLAVFGVKSGRIEEVFGFEPVEISVTAERLDLLLRDDTGALFHVEEQRNLTTDDLYRCAAYHFLAAKQWRPTPVVDIILASGDVSIGTKKLETRNGVYTPIIIDFTERDGAQRLREIREAVAAGTFDQWMELAFVPLYGKATGVERAALAEAVIHFERELYAADLISDRLLAATLIMSNKLIDKARLLAMWEEIKMLDILEIAEEKGIEKGKTLGEVAATRDILVEMLIERFGLVPSHLSHTLLGLDNLYVLKSLVHQALKCQSLSEFEAMVEQVR
jgi:hypothetical protein